MQESNALRQPSKVEGLPEWCSDILSEFDQLDTLAAAVQPARHSRPFIKFPVNYAGMVLDHGRASAYAIHLLVLKFNQGPGYVNNEARCRDRYGIERRGFRSGNKLLRVSGVLDRSRNGGRPSGGKRRFASEKFKLPPSRYFVGVPSALIELKDSFAIALFVVVGLSPVPVFPRNAAKRIGISSENKVRQLLALLEPHLSVDRPSKGAIRIARRGYVFPKPAQSVKNVPGKSVPGKNVPTYSSWKVEPQKLEETSQKPVSAFAPLPPLQGGAYAKEAILQRKVLSSAEPASINLSSRKMAALEAIAEYNAAAEHHGYQACDNVTFARVTRLAKRLDEIGGLDAFRAAISAIPSDSFLSGRIPSKDGTQPFRMSIDRLLQAGGMLGDVLASLLEKANEANNPRTWVGPNGKKWGWWEKPGLLAQIKALPLKHWEDALAKTPPNGTWPWWMFGPPPGHADCFMPATLIAGRGWMEKYQGQKNAVEHA